MDADRQAERAAIEDRKKAERVALAREMLRAVSARGGKTGFDPWALLRADPPPPMPPISSVRG